MILNRILKSLIYQQSMVSFKASLYLTFMYLHGALDLANTRYSYQRQ